MVKEVRTCVREHRTLVKCLAVLLFILILVLIGLFVALLINKDHHTCSSEQCIKASAEIIRYTDLLEEPCGDFYEFACGNFVNNQKEIPPATALEQLNAMIAAAIVSMDPQPFQMEKMFYQSCMNLAAIDMNQDDTIMDIFRQLGDWPVLQGSYWNGSRYHWKDFAIQSKHMGLKFEWFLEFNLFEDYNFTRANILKIDIPRYLRPVGKDQRFFRKELLTDIALYFGASKTIAHYETSRTIDFEDELGEIAERQRHKRIWYNPAPRLTIREVQEQWPSIQWLDLINKATGNTLSEYDYVVFDLLDYIRELNKLLMGTPKRIQVDFMMWKLIEESFWPYLSQPIRERFEKYNRVVLNQRHDQDRESFCTREAQNLFPLVAESVFIRKHVTDEKRKRVREMIALIRQRYIRLVETAPWMNNDRNLRRLSLKKIQEVNFIIGGPDEVFNDNFGNQPFVFRSLNVIEMVREKQKRNHDEMFALINQPIVTNRLEHFKRIVNISDYAFIYPNTIIIPAEVLQDRLYSPNVPNYLNYATLGKSIAKTLFEHLYRGNTTYANGGNASWWSSDAFDETIKCLNREAANFPNSEYKRSRKLKENIADFVAVDVAYEAYREWMRTQPQEQALPGLKLSPNHLFWVETSRITCSKTFTRHERDNSRFSVIGPLRNSRNFAEEYNCARGSRMNPPDKCRIL